MAASMSLESPGDDQIQLLVEAGVNPSVASEFLAAAPGSCSSRGLVVGVPMDQIRETNEIIESVEKLIQSSTVTVNKHQCKRIAGRYSVLAERLKTDDHWDGDSVVQVGEACDRGGSSGSEPGFDDLIRVLQKGKNLISRYCASHNDLMTTLICRADNREEFAEHNDEFDAVVSKLGLQGREDATSELSYCAMQKTLTADAEADKTEMQLQMAKLKQTGVNDMEKSAQVVLEKTMSPVTDVKKLVEDHPEKLPSYLTIDLSKIEFGGAVREYVRLSQQDREEELGWASVRSGRWINFDFAIKVFNCDADGDGKVEWNQKQLLKEVGSLVELQHPHVVRLVGFGKDANRSVLVMELMDSDLREFMKKRKWESARSGIVGKPFTESEELDVIFQIAKGMHFIHSKGYAHGDLKCSNIMVKSNGKCLEVKIGDLRGCQKRGEWNSEAFKQANQAKRTRWTAPEALDHYNNESLVPPSWEMLRDSDIFSFGMTCYEIVTGKLPFQDIRGREVLQKLIKDRVRPDLPENLDKNLKGLIESCWDEDRKNRPGFEAICHFLDMKPPSKSAVDKYPVYSMVAAMHQINLFLRRLLIPASEKPSQINRSYYVPEDLRIPDYLKIEPEQLKRGEEIGSGSSATVYKTKWLRCKFAQKVLKKRLSVTKALQHEINSLIKVSRHPCIVQIVGISIKPSDGECSIIMEYMKGSLRKLIDSRKRACAEPETKPNLRPFDFDEEVLIISRIALGMAYLHSQGFVHRDLNSSNVLAQEYPGRSIDVKIVDFGLSDHEESLRETHSHDGGDDPKATPTDHQVPSLNGKKVEPPLNGYYSGYGTLFYRPPEMLPLGLGDGQAKEDLLKLGLPDKSLKPDLETLKAADVYSFAMTCHEVMTGSSPCSELLERMQSKDLKSVEAYAKIRSGGYRPKWPVLNRSVQLDAHTLLELKSFEEKLLHDKTTNSFQEELLELKLLNMEMLKRERPALKLLGQLGLELELKWLVERCWRTIPKDRPTFDDICKVLLTIQNTSSQLNQVTTM